MSTFQHQRRPARDRLFCTALIVAVILVVGPVVGPVRPLFGQAHEDITRQHSPIKLKAIEFPAWTDLSGLTTTPPQSAPLAQQVVFRFSAGPNVPEKTTITEPPGYGALTIYAELPADYTGPDCVVDWSTNTIPARGTWEKSGKTVVFTPSFPRLPIDLTPRAELSAVPGLLPDMDYIVYVPLGTGASIPNLTQIDPAVQNPIVFTTVMASLPALFYGNHRPRAPEATTTCPADGDVNVPVNTLSGSVPGFPQEMEFFVDFDEPLHFARWNIEGRDIDGDGVLEQNVFLLYNEPILLGAYAAGAGGIPSIVSVDRRTGADTLVGETRLAQPPYSRVDLKSIAVKRNGVMLGSSGSTLYNVEYRDPGLPGICRLGNERLLGGYSDVRGLAFLPSGTLCAVSGLTGDVLAVDEATGAVSVLLALGTAYGELFDIALRADGVGFAIAVAGSGTPSAWSTLLEVDPATGVPLVAWSGAGDYTSVSMAGFSRIALYAAPSLNVEIFDTVAGAFVPAGGYAIAGNLLPAGAAFDIENSLAELGMETRLVSNSWQGARVELNPSGILPFGETVEILARRNLSSISFGSRVRIEGALPAECDLLATFVTFDPGPAVVDDYLVEVFLDHDLEADAIAYEGLPPAEWNVQDSDGLQPDYQHLLASYGLSGRGGLGDFVPTGFFPTIYLDTDSQQFPLPDGSTPGVLVPTVVKGGVFDFQDIVIPDGVTVVGLGSNPLVLTATGRIDIAGVIDVSGERGSDDVTFNTAFVPTPGGKGGPGGGKGGVSHPLVPADFGALTDLRSPMKAEDGRGDPNCFLRGGQGGFTGADGTDVRYNGGSAGSDRTSRGSGGGGGSFLQKGGKGYHGLGKYGADPEDPGRYFIRDAWLWDDGAPADMPGYVASEHIYWTQNSPGGAPGPVLFGDGSGTNDFIGAKGEIPFLTGGQGGGGGGSRLDSMNPATVGLAAAWNPPVDRSAYDAKGGGGGGAGGALGLYALGDIVIRPTGSLLAVGGDGGGGEVIGHSNYGGGGGGGSGGAIIIDSGVTIHIESGALIDVSGGWPGEAKEVVKYTTSALIGNPCLNPLGNGDFRDFHKATYCAWSVGDGGFGGHGLVQLQVPDWKTGLKVDDLASIKARLCEVDWHGADGLCDFTLNQTHCGCGSSNNCASTYYHYKVNYPAPSHPEFPTLSPDPLQSKWAPGIDPALTPTAVGSLSYGLSDWIDCGQVMFRPPVAGFPAPRFVGFTGIDGTGRVITQNGYIPNPTQNDIVVDAPDVGLTDYIPDTNSVAILFQGAQGAVPGSGEPDPASFTAWTADIETVSGSRFVRFRVSFDTALGVPLTATNPKPQVNMVRIRVQY
jgi:hypothetical protein